MNLKDPAIRIRKLREMRYSADGATLGVEIERQDGAVFEVALREDDTRRFIELLLSLARQAAKAPQSSAVTLEQWAGNPIDVDKASVLDVSTPTHTVMALSFGSVNVGFRFPRLMLDSLVELEATAEKKAARKKPTAN